MTATEAAVPTRPAEPIDAVAERLNDPAVAASLVTLLDNAELLSTLVLGLSGMVSRSEMIIDSFADGVGDLRAAAESRPEGAPSLSDLGAVAGELAAAAPALRQVLSSPMVSPATIDLLSLVSDAAVEGAETARRNETSISAFGALKALKEPEVQRGLGLLIEISRSLGRRL
ncbi:MAG: DUF1641 domain-containing protein [Acidimicrobiales bacterium]